MMAEGFKSLFVFFIESVHGNGRTYGMKQNGEALLDSGLFEDRSEKAVGREIRRRGAEVACGIEQ